MSKNRKKVWCKGFHIRHDDGSMEGKTMQRVIHIVTYAAIAITIMMALCSCGEIDNEDVSGYYDGRTCYSEMDVVDLNSVPVPLTSSTMQSGAATNGGPSVRDLGGAVCYETDISGDMSMVIYEDGSFSFNYFDTDPIEGSYVIDDDYVCFSTDDGETATAVFYKTGLKFNYVDGETVQYIFRKI